MKDFVYIVSQDSWDYEGSSTDIRFVTLNKNLAYTKFKEFGDEFVKSINDKNHINGKLCNRADFIGFVREVGGRGISINEYPYEEEIL